VPTRAEALGSPVEAAGLPGRRPYRPAGSCQRRLAIRASMRRRPQRDPRDWPMPNWPSHRAGWPISRPRPGAGQRPRRDLDVADPPGRGARGIASRRLLERYRKDPTARPRWCGERTASGRIEPGEPCAGSPRQPSGRGAPCTWTVVWTAIHRTRPLAAAPTRLDADSRAPGCEDLASPVAIVDAQRLQLDASRSTAHQRSLCRTRPHLTLPRS